MTTLLALGRGRLFAPESETYPMTMYENAFEHWQTFIDGLKAQRANYTSASRSLLTTQVIEACYNADPQQGRNR